MILIFEGCDCSGKSTLIKNLQINTLIDWRLLNYKYPTLYKQIFDLMSQLKEDSSAEMIIEQFTSYMTSFYIFEQLKISNVICDRFWVGEFIYCAIRGYQYKREFEKKWIDIFLDKMHSIDGFLIYVKADLKVIQKRMKKAEKNEYITSDEAKIIISQYERIFEYIKKKYDRVIEIDTTKMTKEQSFNKLMKGLAKHGVF